MIDLSPYAEKVNKALSERVPCLLVTVGADGFPDVGPKGSVMVYDNDHLAFWERTFGQHLANLRQSPKVCILYLNLTDRAYLRFFGTAELHESGPLRDDIMRRTVPVELERDPERKGLGVLVRVDKVIDNFGRTTMTREE